MTDHFALVDEEIVEVVRDQAREVQFAGDNGVVDTLQDEADDTPPPESKIRPILREVMTLQSNLIVKVSVDTAVLCLRKQGQPSPVFCESAEQGGDQFASQEMTYLAERRIPGSSEVVDLKISFLVQINWFVSEHRHL